MFRGRWPGLRKEMCDWLKEMCGWLPTTIPMDKWARPVQWVLPQTRAAVPERNKSCSSDKYWGEHFIQVVVHIPAANQHLKLDLCKLDYDV